MCARCAVQQAMPPAANIGAGETARRGRELRRSHLITGLAGLLAFLGTGAYLRAHFGELYAAEDQLRFMYRANHVYLLFGSLLNLALGLFLTPAEPGWRMQLSRLGSLLLVSSPALLLYAFWFEVPTATIERTCTYLGVFTATGGLMALLVARRPLRLLLNVRSSADAAEQTR
jgi:hypothetical protein